MSRPPKIYPPPAIIPADFSVSTAPKIDSRPAGDEKAQSNLPKLPIPSLEKSCQKYLEALKGLQDEDEHARTKSVVQDFLTSGEGAKWQKKLEEYDQSVDSYIEEFWCKSASDRPGVH